VGIILGIWRLANKESFDRLSRAYKTLSFRTLFRKVPMSDNAPDSQDNTDSSENDVNNTNMQE